MPRPDHLQPHREQAVGFLWLLNMEYLECAQLGKSLFGGVIVFVACVGFGTKEGIVVVLFMLLHLLLTTELVVPH